MKRLFLAISLPDNLKKDLGKKQNEIKQLFPEEARETAFKWVSTQNFHITWEFLGDTRDQDIIGILEKTKEQTARLNPFDIVLSKICFDKNQNPRLIWVEAHGAGKQFHITLARVKQWLFKQIEPEEIPQLDIVFEPMFQARSIDLMESQLSKQGPSYFLLQKFPLA